MNSYALLKTGFIYVITAEDSLASVYKGYLLDDENKIEIYFNYDDVQEVDSNLAFIKVWQRILLKEENN